MYDKNETKAIAKKRYYRGFDFFVHLFRVI